MSYLLFSALFVIDKIELLLGLDTRLCQLRMQRQQIRLAPSSPDETHYILLLPREAADSFTSICWRRVRFIDVAASDPELAAQGMQCSVETREREAESGSAR